MALSASDFYDYLQPQPCDLRVFLFARGTEAAAPPSPYVEVLRQLGRRHEARHLAQLGPHLDLHAGNTVEREERTRQAVRDGAAVIYQPRLSAIVDLNGTSYQLVGEPDYFIRDGGGYVIRDSKVARRITESDHPEILRQVETYGWLYEHSVDSPLAGLEVHAGTDEIVPVQYDGGRRALGLLSEIVRWQGSDDEPYHPVSWSGCGPCPFNERCLTAAAQRKDPALLPGVDKGLATGLRDQGILTWDDLYASLDEGQLAEFKRPYGTKMQRVGKKATEILRSAQAFRTQTEVWHARPVLPDSRDWVMFDLEGFPPQLDEDERAFVWGMQVFGDRPGEYLASTPGAGPDADEIAWVRFLGQAAEIFRERGDIPFVHWATYERDRLRKYVARYGDRDRIAERVSANLLDLLPLVRACVALPLPSYSLKVLEGYVGYRRTQVELGGDWAMATYFEAAHTGDAERAAALIAEVLKYNREDLEATWAVLRWLLAHRS